MPRVRLATPDDAAGIAWISIDAWRHNYRGLIDDTTLASLSFSERLADWHYRLTYGSQALLAFRGKALLGWVGIDGFRHSPDMRLDVLSGTHGWGELQGFYVAPQAQRQGIGAMLWQAARLWFLERAYRHVGLWVLAENLAAIRFYEACGFHDQRLDQNFEINGQPLIERLMARRL